MNEPQSQFQSALDIVTYWDRRYEVMTKDGKCVDLMSMAKGLDQKSFRAYIESSRHLRSMPRNGDA